MPGRSAKVGAVVKIVAFSTIHIQDAEHGASIAGELADWRARLAWAFDDAPAIFLCESGPVNNSPAGFKTVCAGIRHTKPYHCRDWSYFAANLQFALWYVMHEHRDFDLCVALQSDCILGTRLQAVADEFMRRPEVIAAPGWLSGSPDTHCMMIKPEAAQDIIYSLPFTPLPKITGRNTFYIEHAMRVLFDGRYWNPWPDCPTIRQEYGTPELYRGGDESIMRWPMLAKNSPETGERYRREHTIK